MCRYYTEYRIHLPNPKKMFKVNTIKYSLNQLFCFVFLKRLFYSLPQCQLMFWKSQRSLCVIQSESLWRRRSWLLRESASSTSMWKKRLTFFFSFFSLSYHEMWSMRPHQGRQTWVKNGKWPSFIKCFFGQSGLYPSTHAFSVSAFKFGVYEGQKRPKDKYISK